MSLRGEIFVTEILRDELSKHQVERLNELSGQAEWTILAPLKWARCGLEADLPDSGVAEVVKYLGNETQVIAEIAWDMEFKIFGDYNTGRSIVAEPYYIRIKEVKGNEERKRNQGQTK